MDFISSLIGAMATAGENEVIKGKGFYISYAPHAGMAGSDHGGGETALVKDGKFFILNGDWRDEFKSAIPNGFEACRAIYEKNKSAQSSWSSDR